MRMSEERELLRDILHRLKNGSVIDNGIEVVDLESEIKTVLGESKQEIITPEIIDYSLGYAAGRNDLRDHFAGLAMQGIIDSLDIDFREVAEDAYAYADAMLIERDKRKNGLGEGL